MKKNTMLVSVIVTLALLLPFLSGCGKPKGALLWIHVTNTNSTVSIDGAEPVPFEEIKNPVLLPANIHKVTVEFLDSGDTETKTMSLLYGYEYRMTFDKFAEASIVINSPIPTNIHIGKVDLGVIPTDKKTIVHAGERVLNGELAGFGYRWQDTRNFQTGDNIWLQPGTDEKHGALYVESDNPGAILLSSIDDEPMTNNGSIFYPMVSPGIVEITEKYTENVIHYVDIFPGKVTTLKFISNHKAGGKTFKLNSPDAVASELFVNWGEGGVTRCDLGSGKAEITDLELDKLTPFRATGLDLKGAQKFFVSKFADKIGVASFSTELPDEINFKTSKLEKPENIELMNAQVFSDVSPDGEYLYVNGGVLTADGERFHDLNSFVPGCWNTETGYVAVVSTASDCGSFEVRVEKFLGGEPAMTFPEMEVEDLIDAEFEYKNPQVYFLDGDNLLGVLGLPERTRIWKVSFEEAILLADIPRGMQNSKLFGNKYLVCYPDKDSFSNGYVVNLETTKITKDTEDIPEISILSDGRLISGYNPNHISASIIYKWVENELKPLWSGVFGLK